MLRRLICPLVLVPLLACGDSSSGGPGEAGETEQGEIGDGEPGDGDGEPGDGDGEPGDGDGEGGDGDGDGEPGDGDGDGTKFDQLVPDMGEPSDQCEVSDDGDAALPCDVIAPPDAFTPEVEWSWAGANGDTQSMVIPLVANLTDDNDDGAIDLCDIPDIVVIAFPTYGAWNSGRLYVLDGATGTEHWHSDMLVNAVTTPALGDLDDDGTVEIVVANAQGNRLIAFAHDGAVEWTGADTYGDWLPQVALANIDNQGAPEIIVANKVFDNLGNLLWSAGSAPGNSATVVADLDDDGDLELILGHAAYDGPGVELWNHMEVTPGFPQVANLDDDPHPEILVAGPGGLSLIEHDGTLTYAGLTPNGDPPVGVAWRRPATIHDFDGDDIAEFALSSNDHYSLFNQIPEPVWMADVVDASGTSAGTAFDFLGDATAEAMYTDEYSLFVYDELGTPIFEIPRSSGTAVEYPVVADVDNDQSAEIVVVSNASYMGQPQTAPCLQVIHDVDDRWVPARRIWNQHTYHVTNVREDGSIPVVEPHHWDSFNTFRTQAQLSASGGGACEPQG